MKKLIAVAILLSAVNSFAAQKVIKLKSYGTYDAKAKIRSEEVAYNSAIQSCEAEVVKYTAKSYKLDVVGYEDFSNMYDTGTILQSLCILDI